MPSFERLVVDRRAHVRQAAAEQAVESETAHSAHPLLMPLALVVIDEQPVDGEGAYRDDWGTLPGPFEEVLNRLVATAPGDEERCWQCGSSAVGWTDGVDDQGWAWQLTGLLWSPVMADEPVNVLCEGCTPLLLQEPAPDVPL